MDVPSDALCVLGLFGRMHVLTVWMSNLTLPDIANNISCDYCVSSSYEHVHPQCH